MPVRTLASIKHRMPKTQRSSHTGAPRPSPPAAAAAASGSTTAARTMASTSSSSSAARPASAHDNTSAAAAAPSASAPAAAVGQQGFSIRGRSLQHHHHQQSHGGARGGGGGAGRGGGRGGGGRWMGSSGHAANGPPHLQHQQQHQQQGQRGPARDFGTHQQHQQYGQPWAGRPPAPTRPPASTASAPAARAAASSSSSAQQAVSGPPAQASTNAVRPPKAKKVDPFAFLPVYDFKTFPPGRAPADRPTLLVLSDPVLVDEALAHLGSPVGLDIEWAPTFQAGAPIKPTSLLQISDGQTIVVIQTLSLLNKCPPGLRAYLEDASVIKLGVGILPDGAKLSRDLGIDCKGCFDLNALRKPDPESPKMAKGLAALTGQYTEHRLHKSKNVTMSNWALARLSPSQIAYAANDVQSAVDIYAALRAEAEASSFALKGPPGWSWSAPGAIPTPGPRVPQDLVERVAAAPAAVDFSSTGFWPPGFERAAPPAKTAKPDTTAWWVEAVELFKSGRSLADIQTACKPATQQSRSLMDVRWAIANCLFRGSGSLTAAQGQVLLEGMKLDTKGRLPLTVMVQELVQRG